MLQDIFQTVREWFSWSLATYVDRRENLRYYPGRIKASIRLTPEAQKAYEMKLRALKTEKAAALKREKAAYEKALTTLHARYDSQTSHIETQYDMDLHGLFAEHAMLHTMFVDVPKAA